MIQSKLEKVEYFLKEYALYLNDIGFGVKPLDFNEDYSHVVPSSGYTPKVAFPSGDSGDSGDRSGSGLGEGEDILDGDQMETDDDEGEHPSVLLITPSKKRPLRNAM